jgi:hypothetical protein
MGMMPVAAGYKPMVRKKIAVAHKILDDRVT